MPTVGEIWSATFGKDTAGVRLGKAAAAFDKAVVLEKKIDDLTKAVDAIAKRLPS